MADSKYPRYRQNATRPEQPRRAYVVVAVDVHRLVVPIALAALVVLAASSSARGREAARPEVTPAQLARAVTAAGLRTHLRALQAIAARNGGTRLAGTRGYEESVAYVARRLREAGYRPRLRSFSFLLSRETRPTQLARVALGGETYRRGRDFLTLQYSGSGTVTAPVVAVDFGSPASGCGASDFPAFRDRPIVLVRRGACFLAQKAQNAAAAGAGAVLIANSGGPGRTAPIAGTLVRPGIRIPVVGVSYALGAAIAQSAGPGAIRLRVSVAVENRQARAANVVAELRGTSGSSVVLVGAHLDSVANGPGINDNGSGSALVLEVARQARRLGARPRLGLRFVWWGAEELGLHGSTAYVRGLTAGGRSSIAAVLNFDMVGSPNFSRFVYDGAGMPPGSQRIEDAFRAYFASRRLPVADLGLGGASDHAPFAQTGIPVGGLFTGADSPKSASEQRAFGGRAERAYDACYHQACDTIRNVNLRVAEQMADAAAVVALGLASRG
jgi:Zn-dependent M28 family amino/carboxypeptidase